MDAANSFHHLIVGDGVTALALAEAVPLRAGDRLAIVGQSAEHFGRGAAYGAEPTETPWRYAYLLNSPADDMDPEFAQWAEDHFEQILHQMQGRRPNWVQAAKALIDKGDYAGLNYPRSSFGDYLEEKGKIALERLRNQGVTVEVISDQAIDIARRDTGFLVTLKSGETLDCTSVDVAPGAPATKRLAGDDSAFSAPTLFGNEARIAEHIRNGKEIFCVGSNATMLDTLRLCQSLVPEQKIKLIACSPSGGLPAPLIPQLPRPVFEPKLSRGHKTADSFLSELHEQMQRARRAGLAIREVRAGARALFVQENLSTYLADPLEAAKVPARLRHWLRAGTRDSIQDFQRLSDTGQVELFSGAVDRIEAGQAGAIVHYRDKDGREHSHETGFVINCSGASMREGHDPLTQSMIDKGVLKVTDAGYVVGSKGQTEWQNLRHLSPATAVIDGEVLPMPLFDAHLLRVWAKRFHPAQD